jgi:hypothetical protein
MQQSTKRLPDGTPKKNAELAQTNDTFQPMPGNSIPEELVTLLHAISEDKDLCDLFLSLQHLSPAVRQNQLLSIAAQMHFAGEDAAVANAVSILAHPRIYEAACSTLRELFP